MKAERRQRIFAFNRQRKAEREKADDLMILLEALPPGQRKNLLKDERCGAILRKYGVGEVSA